jgi:hypothetical protein
VSDRTVAESYAQEHGLAFLRTETLQFRAQWLPGSQRCVNAMRGAIGDGPPGVLCQRLGLRGPALPSAQYEIPGLGQLINGLWVRRSGRSIWTRLALPRGYAEVMLPSETFMARYRVGAASEGDEHVARRLLGGEFAAWLTGRARDSGRLDFEVRYWVLFISGPIDAFKSRENLDAFAGACARIAAEVAALAGGPAPVAQAAAHVWACEVCGGSAGSIALEEHGEVRREAFGSVLTGTLGPGVLNQLRAALSAADAAAVYQLDPEFAPWWCPACRRSYCGDHWLRRDVFDEQDPSWHDSVRGRCPEGHERMLED